MTKSNGIKSLKQAAKLLNRHAPDGESLAYINPDEGRLLKAHGGSGIMTVAGVPSYNWFTDAVGWVKDKAVDYFSDGDPVKDAGGVKEWGKWVGGDDKQSNFISDLAKGVGKGILKRYSDPKNIAGDTLSLLTFLRGKKDAQGLNEHEMNLYNDLLGQTAGHEAEFDLSTAGGTELTAPKYTDDLSTLASFTDVTLPPMKTTAAAEGGRIGYDNGGIGQLMPRLGYGSGSPHGIELPSEGVNQFYESNALGAIDQTNEDWFAQNWTPPSTLEKDLQGKPHNEQSEMISERVSANFELLKGMRDRGMIDENLTDKELLETAIKNIKHNYLGQKQEGMPQIQIESQDQTNIKPAIQIPSDSTINTGNPYSSNIWTAAQGGRIGYGLGSKTATAYADPNKVVTGDPRDNILNVFANKFSGRKQVQPLEGGQVRSGDNFFGNMISQAPQGSQFQLLEEYQNYVTEVGEENAMPFEEWQASRMTAAQGGRIGYENGGIEGLMPRLGYAGGNQVLPLLDLGGQEKDYREDGGFVPIGRKEKADDVPARLSKNEFVFTADAVRAAGGGDIDEGAQRMYNVMKNLEAGGEISQETQGKI